jgi:hypothetical protein
MRGARFHRGNVELSAHKKAARENKQGDAKWHIEKTQAASR